MARGFASADLLRRGAPDDLGGVLTCLLCLIFSQSLSHVGSVAAGAAPGALVPDSRTRAECPVTGRVVPGTLKIGRLRVEFMVAEAEPIVGDVRWVGAPGAHSRWTAGAGHTCGGLGVTRPSV